MAVYKINPEKDASIYSLFPFMNTGLDEIAELTTTTFPNYDDNQDAYPQVSRTLIKFADDDIQDVIDNVVGGLNLVGDVRLKLRLATAEGLNADTEIEAYPVSGSWNMGTGKYLDNPLTTNGCSWQWQDFSGSTAWQQEISPPIMKLFVTNSFDPIGIPGGAHWWYRDPQNKRFDLRASQSISFTSDNDLNLNVTNAVNRFYSASKGLVLSLEPRQVKNDGFIIKQTGPNEFINLADKATELKYFSRDTNTIYPPELEFRWDDSIHSTDIPTIDDESPIVTLTNNPGTFMSGSVHAFRLGIRPKFPARVYQTSSLYVTDFILPSGSSHYAIKDLDTNEFIIDFDDEYTKLSADSSGNYFTIYMNGLQPERYYKVLIKTKIGPNTLILDNNNYFKVING